MELRRFVVGGQRCAADPDRVAHVRAARGSLRQVSVAMFRRVHPRTSGDTDYRGCSAWPAATATFPEAPWCFLARRYRSPRRRDRASGCLADDGTGTGPLSGHEAMPASVTVTMNPRARRCMRRLVRVTPLERLDHQHVRHPLDTRDTAGSGAAQAGSIALWAATAASCPYTLSE